MTKVTGLHFSFSVGGDTGEQCPHIPPQNETLQDIFTMNIFGENVLHDKCRLLFSAKFLSILNSQCFSTAHSHTMSESFKVSDVCMCVSMYVS